VYVQQQEPFIVTVVQQPEKQTTVLDLFLGSLSLTVMAVVAGVVLGGLLGLLLVRWHRRHPPESAHLPPISPFVPDPNRPPSSPTR
jgi:ABC-type phosphate transport system permease subunit